MNTVGIIPGHKDPYYYHFFFEGKVVSETHYGTETQLKRKMKLLRIDSILELICQFKRIDDSIVDSRKNTHVHKEHRDKIQAYIDWAFKNRESNTQAVIGHGGRVAREYMTPILDLIHDDQPLKKELVSLTACVIETSNVKQE